MEIYFVFLIIRSTTSSASNKAPKCSDMSRLFGAPGTCRKARPTPSPCLALYKSTYFFFTCSKVLSNDAQSVVSTFMWFQNPRVSRTLRQLSGFWWQHWNNIWTRKLWHRHKAVTDQSEMRHHSIIKVKPEKRYTWRRTYFPARSAAFHSNNNVSREMPCCFRFGKDALLMSNLPRPACWVWIYPPIPGIVNL